MRKVRNVLHRYHRRSCLSPRILRPSSQTSRREWCVDHSLDSSLLHVRDIGLICFALLCFVTVADPDGPRWEFCSIPSCLEVCGSRANLQEDYIGSINTTVSGQACIPWKSILSLILPPSNSSEYESNFCRNPTSSNRAYCFVSEDFDGEDKNWEYCDVPFCEDLD